MCFGSSQNRGSEEEEQLPPPKRSSRRPPNSDSRIAMPDSRASQTTHASSRSGRDPPARDSGATQTYHRPVPMQQESDTRAGPPSDTSATPLCSGGSGCDSGYADSMASPNSNAEAFSSSALQTVLSATGQYLDANYIGISQQQQPGGRRYTAFQEPPSRRSASGSRSAASTSRPASQNGSSAHQKGQPNPQYHSINQYYPDNNPAPGDYGVSIQGPSSQSVPPQVVVNVHPPPSVYNYGAGPNYAGGPVRSSAWDGSNREHAWADAAAPSTQTWASPRPAASQYYGNRSNAVDNDYHAAGSHFDGPRPIHPSRIYDDVPDDSNSLGASTAAGGAQSESYQNSILDEYIPE